MPKQVKKNSTEVVETTATIAAPAVAVEAKAPRLRLPRRLPSPSPLRSRLRPPLLPLLPLLMPLLLPPLLSPLRLSLPPSLLSFPLSSTSSVP